MTPVRELVAEEDVRPAGARLAAPDAEAALPDAGAGPTDGAPSSEATAATTTTSEDADPASQELLADLIARVERSANGRPGDTLPLAEQALALATALGDRPAQVRITYFIGYAHRLLSQDVEALTAMERSLHLAQELNDPVWEASAYCGMGTVHAGFGDYESAIEFQERSLAIRTQIDDRFGMAVSLNNLGLTFQEVGLFPDRARELLHESYAIFSSTGHRHCMADSLLHLAALDLAEAEQHAATDPELATAIAEAAVRSASEAVGHARTGGGNPRLLSDSLTRLASALLACGRLDEACTALDQAAEVADGLGIAQIALKLTLARGRLHRLRGAHDDAVTELVGGLEAADTLLRTSERVQLLEELVTVHEERGDLAAALAAHRQLLAAVLRHRDESADRRARALNAQRDLERAEMEAEMARLRSQQLELANEVLERQAMQDGLTGLANRRSFDQALQARTASPEARLTCLIGDLDHFKHVNDHWSHMVGDEVLRRVAQIVSAAVRGSDLVARLGGEELAVLLADGDGEDGVAPMVCERIRESIASYDWEQVAPGLRVTIRIGAARRRLGESGEALLSRADELMYQAKAAGRNRAVIGED